MYRLVFEGYMDRLLQHRNVRRRQGVVWFPTLQEAEHAADQLRAMGEVVSIQALSGQLESASGRGVG